MVEHQRRDGRVGCGGFLPCYLNDDDRLAVSCSVRREGVTEQSAEFRAETMS